MNAFKIGCYTLFLVIPIAVILTYIAFGMVFVGIDAVNTRSLECQTIIVENTSSINDGYSITFFVNEHMILDTSNGDNIKKWGRLEPGDAVSMKFGKQTAVFC